MYRGRDEMGAGENVAAHRAFTAVTGCLGGDPAQDDGDAADGDVQYAFDLEKAGSGWEAPALAPWLEAAVDAASQQFFGAPVAYNGEGGSIPFMGMLGEKFPGAQFMITGVLGPHSNAHGPNEFLHIPMGKHVTACVARVVAEHHAASLRGETGGTAAQASTQERGEHGCC